MNTILDFVYNHNGLIVLLWMLLTAVLLFRRLDAANRILQGFTLVLWLAATAFLTFFERSPVMDVRPIRKEKLLPIISMMIMPISMAISVPIGPATGRNVVPGMANTPQPTMQPKAIAQTSTGER